MPVPTTAATSHLPRCPATLRLHSFVTPAPGDRLDRQTPHSNQFLSFNYSSSSAKAFDRLAIVLFISRLGETDTSFLRTHHQTTTRHATSSESLIVSLKTSLALPPSLPLATLEGFCWHSSTSPPATSGQPIRKTRPPLSAISDLRAVPLLRWPPHVAYQRLPFPLSHFLDSASASKRSTLRDLECDSTPVRHRVDANSIFCQADSQLAPPRPHPPPRHRDENLGALRKQFCSYEPQIVGSSTTSQTLVL